jgi:hypothetical protein
MTSDTTARALRRRLGLRGRGRPIAAGARDAAVAYVRRRREEGASQEGIAREIGVSQCTVSRWLGEPTPGSMKPGFVPIEVASGIEPRGIEPRGIVVTTPRGLVIEGLDVDALCSVIARIG